jgi:NAD(P)-dependent dehydrogenase (short-subunit alcohol dehydrogenase family)
MTVDLSTVQARHVEILMVRAPVVVISGAAMGLGRRIAERFEEGGFRAHVCDANPAAVQEFRASHPKAAASIVDVSDARQVDTWFDEIAAKYGCVDVLVNNAGIAGPTAPVEKIEPAEWDRTIAVDLNGQFYCTRRAVPLLRAAGGGSIVNISSIDGMIGSPGIISYIASKWAVRGMTKAAAIELAPRGIRVNSIHPGHVHTLLASDATTDHGFVRRMIDAHVARHAPMGRTGEPREIARLAVFLASDDSSYSTGSEFVADGGFIAGYPSPASSLVG